VADFAVYNTTTKEVLMVVTDAANPNDAAWNPSGSSRITIDRTTYNLLYPNIKAILAYIAGLLG
jgi:hypothetical protein